MVVMLVVVMLVVERCLWVCADRGLGASAYVVRALAVSLARPQANHPCDPALTFSPRLSPTGCVDGCVAPQRGGGRGVATQLGLQVRWRGKSDVVVEGGCRR